jgi:uroporphyrinogen-III synthase
MQRESRQRRKSMREIAAAILLGDDLRKTKAETDERSAGLVS